MIGMRWDESGKEKRREEKRREEKRREGKGREEKGREGKGREEKRREEKGRDRFPNVLVPFAILHYIYLSLRYYITPLSIHGLNAFRS